MEDRIWHQSAGPLDAVGSTGLADAPIIPLPDKNVDAPHAAIHQPEVRA